MATDSPQNRGRGECSGLFEPQTEQIVQLPWHEDTVCAFVACANEIAPPSSQTKRPALPSDGQLPQGQEVPIDEVLIFQA